MVLAADEGCPVAAVALDLGPEWGPVRKACGRALDGWVGLLAVAPRAEGARGDEARARAETAMAAFEGALLISRARRTWRRCAPSPARFAGCWTRP